MIIITVRHNPWVLILTCRVRETRSIVSQNVCPVRRTTGVYTKRVKVEVFHYFMIDDLFTHGKGVRSEWF